MDFSPNNNVVKLCVSSMAFEGKGLPEEASKLCIQAWDEATNDFEKFIAAHFVAQHQKNIADKLKWFETALQFALKANNDAAKSAFSSLYSNIAKCYDGLNDPENSKKNHDLSILFKDKISDDGSFSKLPVGSTI